MTIKARSADDDGVEPRESAARLQQERALVTAAQRGDDEAWRELFDEYYPRLYGFMRSRVRDEAQAEDLASEAFLDAFRGLPRFRWRGKPFGAWLFKVARNRWRQHLRSEAARPSATIEVPSSLPAPGDGTTAMEIDETLRALPDEYREAIELRYVLGLSGQEAAAAMGRSHGSFRMLLHRAVGAFKREFTSDTA